MQWACLSLIWSGGLIGTRSYYCDGWSEKRINKLLNSYFIMPYKLYWSPFFISFNSCLIFVNLGCYTTVLSDNVWRWFVKLFFPFIFSVSWIGLRSFFKTNQRHFCCFSCCCSDLLALRSPEYLCRLL